jgi:hypothetical protein
MHAAERLGQHPGPLHANLVTTQGEGEDKGLAVAHQERTKETKAAEQLAAMIHEDLSKMDGCPKHGVTVTVYGIPWNAMLTFGVAAGPVRNKAELQNFFLS